MIYSMTSATRISIHRTDDKSNSCCFYSLPIETIFEHTICFFFFFFFVLTSLSKYSISIHFSKSQTKSNGIRFSFSFVMQLIFYSCIVLILLTNLFHKCTRIKHELPLILDLDQMYCRRTVS